MDETRFLWPAEESYERTVDFKDYSIFAKDNTPTIDYVTKDPIILARVQKGLTDSWKRAPEGGMGASGSEPYGELEIITTKDRFIVGLFSQFVIDGRYEDSRNAFVSQSLARAVDELHTKATGKGLTKEKVKKLSGQSFFDLERQEYEKIGKE